MIYKLLFPLPLLTLLTACPAPDGKKPPVSGPQQEAEIYTAYGTEPFWDLEIGPKTTKFSGLGIDERVFETPAAKLSFNGTRYPSPQITIDITKTKCNDGMSDREFGDTVTVEIGKARYRGCGGNPLPPEKLDGTQWQFEQIGDKAAAAESLDRKSSLQFTDGQMSGSVGCNQFSESYSFENGTLTVGPMRSTRMMCRGILGEQEMIFSKLMATPVKVRFNSDGDMVLTDETSKVKLSRSF